LRSGREKGGGKGREEEGSEWKKNREGDKGMGMMISDP